MTYIRGVLEETGVLTMEEVEEEVEESDIKDLKLSETEATSNTQNQPENVTVTKESTEKGGNTQNVGLHVPAKLRKTSKPDKCKAPKNVKGTPKTTTKSDETDVQINKVYQLLTHFQTLKVFILMETVQNNNGNLDLISAYDCNGIDSEYDSGIHSEAVQLPIYFVTAEEEREGGKNKSKNPFERVVNKSGKSNVFRKVPNLWAAYIRDLGNTLVNSRWIWTLVCFASSYLLTWSIFAVSYMLIAHDNNDISEENPSETPCLVGIKGFAGYFLLSLETQHTIGYGTRYITSNCAEGTFLISFQMIMGISLCGVMTSVVYTKMIRPFNQLTTALFSKVCIVCLRDGELCLVFRVRDKKNRHQVNTKINLYLVRRKNNEPFLHSLKLEPPGLLLWPLEIVHKITPNSPFWDLSAKDLIMQRFELLVTMNGTSLTTAQSSMTKASYLSKEICWGHRFKPCVKYDYLRHGYYIDSPNFNTTEEVITPLCSAKRLRELSEELISTHSSPLVIKSPSSSRHAYEDSCLTSSGISSISDEFTFAEMHTETVGTVARKLSTIRELNSLENLVSEELMRSKADLFFI
ncbi:hypothetical protein FQA39_LY04705 [Lamprigera yunnana]|nr:hypothetical protein FQA39_LY04705 [Lamprigera yunnana]